MIIIGLFKAYYNNPKLLHKCIIRKINITMRQYTNEVIYFLDGDEVKNEIKSIIDTDLSGLEDDIKNVYEQKKKIWSELLLITYLV